MQTLTCEVFILCDAVIEHFKGSGFDVLGTEDGQRVLDMANVDGDKVAAVGADGKEQTYEDGMFEQMVESGVLKRAQKTEEPSEAKVDLTDNQGNSTPQPDLSSESKGAEQSSGVQAEVPQAEVQENAPMPMRVVGKGKNAVQEEDWLATTPKRGHDYVFKESGLDAEEANAFVENKVAEAEKNLEKVKGKAPKMGTNIAAYKEAKADYEARVAEAQKAVDYWHAVKAERDKVLLEERRARKEKDKALYDDAVAQEEQRKAEMAQKAAEQEALGSNAVAPAIKEKWENAPKVDGGADEITLPNGEVVTGHYVLTESGAASASHQATNVFAETEGYPVDVNGETVNDRDYKRDAEAQQVTRGMAADYDSRALQSPVVVSGDGVVLSGNGRTMAGEIAALNGSDAKYNAYLRGHAGKFGFTTEQVEGFEHPRVVFVPDGEMPYTSETFAKFNQREQKSQSRTEMAVKLGKVVDDALFGRVMDVIGRHESLAEFYADDAATAAVVKELADAGVIPQTEMAQLFDGGRLSESGQAMVEGVLVGKVFQGSPDAVRQITEVKSMRKAVMAALPEVVACHRLGGGYDLSKELAAAVDLVYKARKAGFKLGQHVSQHARQGNLFQLDDGATVADYNNAAVMMLADVMNDGRVTQLKKVLSFYNTQAADSAQGIGDMFAGGVKSKGQIINEVNELLNNGQEYDRRTPSVADGQGVGGEGGEQGDVAGPSHQGGEGSERGLSEAFDGLAAQLKTAEGEERKRVLGEMRDGIARFAEENGYPVPEFLLTREDFLAAVPEKDRAKYVEWLDDGWHCPAYYEKGKVYYFVEGCDKFDKDVAETLAHEYTHADNSEFPENVNALTYALEDTHEVTRDELVGILETLSNSSHYGDEAERLESEGKNANPMLADEVIAHAVARMVRDGEQVLDGITNNPTLQFIIKRAYKVRENERRHNILAREASERSSKTIEGSEANSGNGQSVAEGESGLGRYGRSARSEAETGEQSGNGLSAVSDGKEVAAPSLEGAKVGVTDGEKSSATGDVVPSGKGNTPLSEKIATASAEVNTEPTEAQKEAGNYKKGHVQVGTFDITIEQPQGSVRKGTDADGKQWESKMNNTYGYIRGAVGVDGDHIDVFLSNDIDGWNGRKVFVVDQYNPDGSFDEHKVMLGFNDADEAKSDYLANYENGWENGRRIDVTAVNLEDFEKWIASSKRKTKPFGEYSSVKNGVVPSGEGKTDNPRQQKAVGKSAQPPTREESILRDVVIEHMKGSGLDVIGTEDGQRVLDMVNEDGAKEHRVYHGSGAEFDHFDHSHMGEGEGAQAYGWGTYVTEVRGIGEGYAIRSKNGISMSREEWSLKRSELESNIYRAKEQLPFLKGEYKAEVEAQISEWEEQLKDYEPHNYLYTVEIPDDNGGNYLDWNGPVPAETIDRITEYLREKYGDEVVNGRWLSNPLLSSKGVDVSARNGAAIYRQLERALGSDKKASQLLSSLGYVGIKYPAEFRSGGRKDDAKNYVIFNENDAEITDHVRFFKTKNGEAYGFTVGGKIYYDPRIANAETPVHEYAHLWASALKANNAKEWKNVVDLMKGTNVWEEVKKTYPELETDDEIADEVLATYSGRRGAERLREEMRKAAAEGDGVMDKAEAVSALQRVKRAIDKFWKAVADFLHIHYTSAEEVADRVMKDLLDGVDPRSMMDGGKSLRPETRVNVVEAEAGHGFKNYAEAKAWAKEHIARTYSGEETGGKGDIRISNAAVDKYLSQSAVDKSESKDVHLAVLKVLPDVIRESVDAEQHADFKKGKDGVRSAANGVNPNVTIHRLYGAVRMDGKLYRVKVTLKENTRTKETPKAYSYEATKIELLEGSLSQTEGSHNLEPSNSKSEVSAGQHGNVSGLTSTFPRYSDKSITAANLLNGVDKSYDGGKFFEDYNKIREQFIGEKGAERADHADEVNTRLDNLSVAREMEAEKKDAKAIKMATGWERGADGKWRYEVGDVRFYDGLQLINRSVKTEATLNDLLEDNKDKEALFASYPSLKNMPVVLEDMGYKGVGEYNYGKETIRLNTYLLTDDDGYFTKPAVEILNHEIQHAIQKIEGFARGGSPAMVRSEIKKQMAEVTKQIRQLRAEGKEAEAKELIKKNRGLYEASVGDDDFGSYKSLAGEVESRNVESRMGMSAEERRASLAAETEDVSREDQIFLTSGDGGETAHSVEMVHKPSKEETVLRDVVVEHMKGSGLDVIGTEDGQRVLDMVNDDGAKEHRVYHGSGAEFDHFDHSHMGEGEGAQAYGWGTYVTEVEGIGRTYAESARKKPTYLYGGKEMPSDEFHDYVLGKIGDRNENMLNDFMYNLERHGVTRAKDILKKGDLAQYKNLFYQSIGDTRNYAEGKIKAARTLLSLKGIRIRKPKSHLYAIEIPEDNGKNYLDWNSETGKDLVSRLVSILRADKELKEAYEGRLSELNKELDKFAPRTLFSDTYVQLAELLGSDKKASQLLSSLGYVGIKYPADNMRGGREDGAKNYVIFNENDAEITDHVRFFKTKNGEAYGFTVGGKIYYDPRIANAETPVHEYAHLWASALKANNAEEWKNVVDLMKGTNVWEEVKKTYPELETDDEIADEVLATYSGRRGAERLREEMRKAAAEGDGVMGKAEAVSALQRVKRAIDKFWKAVADFLHIHYTSAEEVADRVMKDLLDGVDPRSMMDGGKSLRPETRVNVVEAEAGHGFKNYAEAKTWAKEHIARTYSGEETGGKGDIRISNAAVDKYLSQSAVDKSESKDVHLAVLKVLPDVIRESVDAEQHADFKKGEDGVRSAENGINPDVTIHRLYGAVRMDGKVYRVKVTLKEDTQNEELAKKAYSYEATKIELLAGTLVKPEDDDPNTNNSITAAKLLNGVEKSYDGGKFFEDYNKIREQFIGEKGAAAADHADEVNTRLDNLSVAREMEAEKKDAKAIKMATGWERGADGKWRYEIADMKEFDRNGNLLYRKHHPDYARYIELQDKELKNLFEEGEELTDKEREEYEALSKKYESDTFGGEKLDNNHTLEAYVDAPELFKAYPELKNVGLRFENTGGNEIASYRYISSVFDVDKDDVGEIVVNTGKVSKNTRTREVKSAVLHEMQHAIQEIEGFAGGGSPKSMQKRFEAAKEEWRARAWADALRYKADEMGEHYNQAAVEKALIDEYKEMGMDNDEWMPDRETRMKGFNYFARGYADRSMDSDIKNFRLNESTRADFSPYVEYTRLGGEVESRNVESRMGMSAEERRASLAAETEDVSREDQIFLMSGDGGRSYSLKDGSFLRSGSYFSGGGLLEEGLKDYLDPKVAVEFNEKISGVYRDNFGNHIVTADVRDVDPKELVKDIDGPVQYFHASPVCKNFSTAKRDGSEVELDKETARSTAQFIGETRPKVVTIENVKGYKNSDALKIITDELTAQGYDWDMGVYNAADYGGYTNRERLIVRAVRDGKLPPKPEDLPEGERKGGWIEAVSDLMEGLPEKKSGVPKWVDERLKGEGIDYRHIDKPLYVFGQGNSRTSIPHAFADELLPTLRTKGGDMIIMPDGRVLKVTPRVLARVTGLADDYEMPATDDLAHTVVGNGIPTQLSEHVIGPLLADVFNGGEPARKDGSAHLGRGNVAGEMGAAEDYTAFASRYGVSEDMVKDYALGMETGNLQKANFALAEIRRTMRVANRGMKLSEFGKLFRPVQKELAERYGDIEVLRQEYIDAEMRERGVMEAARKRAEEEAAKRKARADELRLLPEEELDRRYFEAVERGDDAAAREMLDEAARRKGYGDTESEYQGVGAWVAPSNPGYETDEARRDAVGEDSPNLNVEDMAAGYSNQPEDIFVHPDKYSQGLSTSKESGKAIQTAIDDIRNGKKEVKIKVYRAVPTSVKESKLRNGDWVTPSKEYAEMHGNNRLEGKYRIIEDEVPAGELWWDGNDVNEWGFDDGNGYKYKNVENSRKLNDLVTRDDNGEIIAPSKRFDENVEDVRYRTSEELGQEYGSRWIDEQTNEDGRHTTQVKNTLNSYKKFGDWVKRDSGGRNVDVLDASSGLGLGTEWLRENGINVEDVEPYPSENRTAPTYISYGEVKKKYDYIISNAVLNVIPDDWRANVLHNMAEKLKVGGKLVINVRSAESIRKQGKEGETRITLDDPSEILVLRPNGSIKAYQKGFTKAELKEWCEKELGKGYSVEIANDKNAGGSYDTAVVVTKNNESGTIGVASEASHPRRSAQAAPNSSAKLGNNQKIANNLSELSEKLSELSEKLSERGMGAHEFLFNVARAFGLDGNNLNKSFYQDLSNSVGIRISDHSASTNNIYKKNNNDEVYGLVVKLSNHRFKSRDDANYLEYVYYPDKLTDERQREIVGGLRKFLQTGDYALLPLPDRINRSGNFEKANGEETSDIAKHQAAIDLATDLHVEGGVEVLTTTEGLEGKKAKAKGWFDPKTGRVVVVLPNNKNVKDVRETIFHEVVVHKGVRSLVGDENFNTFLDNIYANAEEKIQQSIDDLSQKYGGDKRKATEEYMAGLSEDGEFAKPENQSFFRKVKDFLVDLLRKVGIKLGFKLTDNDLRYILWRSWKNLKSGGRESLFDKAEDVVMQHELGQTDEARSASGENGIMFRDGSEELKGIVDKMKADVERLHEGELDDLRSGARAIGGRLSELNKAMRLQRAYDMSTVASVTELAKTMLKNGLLSEMSDYDVRRLLSVVNNVHGKGDIRPYVQKVVDMMVGNRLRNMSKAFDKLLAMRGKKVDARGVEVQGELDLAGQRMADVVWKGIGMSDDDVADMCADAQDRMMSANGAEAAAAATDYAGWQIVMRYNETIRDSKSEEVRLREDLKRAKEDYDAGRMTREAYMEFRESTNDAIRENRIERAEAYEELYEQLGGAYGESIKRAADFKAAEKARVLEIQHNANSDMEGRPARSYRKDTAVDKVLNSSPVQLLFAPLGTFDQMLRMFGSKNVKGEGYLWNRYMRGWLTATENEYTGYRDATAELDAKAAEVLGKGKTWADLFALERKLPKATVRVWDNGEMRELELPQGNLLYIYMVDKMADGRMKLRKMGVTEDDVAAIEDFLDPRLKEIGDWLQEVYLVEKRGKYNEVHERMFGAAMASIDNYFPLKILKDARAENVDVGMEKRESEMASTITGSVVKRTRNALALDLLNSDAFSVVLDHLQQMEHWSAFAEWNRDLNTLLSYKHFRNQVKNMRSAYGSGERLWEAFDKVARIAAGTYTPPKAFADKLAVNIAKGVTAAKISLRVFTALKQFTSFPAYLSDSNPVYLLKGVANPYGSWKWCMENLPLFEKRWKSRMAGDPRLLKNEMDWGLWRDNVVQMAAKWGMTPNGFVDALTVCIGARAMYETRRRKYIRYGYGLEEAERRAKQDASILYNQTQQSSEGAFLSALQVDRSWYSVLFTVFRNSSMSYTRQLYAALRNTGRRIAGGAKFKGISEAFMAKQMERDGIDPDKASKNAKAEYRKSWINDFVRAGVFGYVLQLAWNCGPYALYMLFGDDEKKGKEMWHDIWTHTAFGSVEGLTGGDVWSAGLQSLWNHFVNGEDFNANSVNKDMPLTSDLLKVVKKVGSDNYGAVNDVLNLLVQAGFGVNPQTLTDAAVAIYDYCGSDVETTKECALLVMRVMNCPQSQMDNIYFDEIDATGEEAKAMSVEEIAERYARYKALRSAPLRALSSDALKAAEKKPRERVMTEAKEQLDGRLMTEEAQRYLDEYEATKKKVTETRALADTDPKAFMQQMPALARSGEFRRYRRVGLYKSEVDKLTKKLLRTSDPAERRALFGKMLDARDKMLKQVKEME